MNKPLWNDFTDKARVTTVSLGNLMVDVPSKSTTVGREVMAVVSKEEYCDSRVLDLSGPDGSAYVLIGIAHGLLKKQGRDPKMFIDIMQSSDYGNLVRFFNDMFGDYFTIVLPEGVDSLEDL